MRIALTTDFSDTARVAYGPAALLARKLEADLVLFHQGYSSIYTPIENEKYFEELEGHLRDVARSDPEFEGLQVEPVLARSDHVLTLDKILADFDLVITASHGHTGFKNFVLGSYAERLVRMSPCDVLVIREHATDFQVGKILVAHDFSNPQSHTLKTAHEWAQRFGAIVTFLSVVDTFTGPLPVESGFEISWTKVFDHARRDAISKIRETLTQERWQDLETRTTVRDGSPARCIIEESEGHDLTVIGKHDQSALEHFFLGSVAEKVVREAKSAVLVVQHPGED